MSAFRAAPTVAYVMLGLTFASHLLAIVGYFMFGLFLNAVYSLIASNPAFGNSSLFNRSLAPYALAIFPLLPIALLTLSSYCLWRAWRAVDAGDYDTAWRYATYAMIGEITFLPYTIRSWLAARNRTLGHMLGFGVPLTLLAVTHYLRELARTRVNGP